jgi:hypothetical protein
MSQDVSDLELRFEELPLRLRLEGFTGETARSIARQWVCPISDANDDTEAYRVRLRKEPRLSFPSPSSLVTRRQTRLQVSTVGSTTHLRMPGARMSFVAGRSGAEIEVHPHLLRYPGLMELAAGGALGHALALTGASFLHGAAVIVDELPILLLGAAGSGKSTAAAAAITAGGQLVSDDSLILHPSASGRLAVRTLRRDLFLRKGSQGVLPTPWQKRLRRVGPATDPRWLLERDDAAAAFRSTLEPAALCVLRIDRRLKSFRLVALSQAVAFTSLLEANASPHLLHPAFPGEQQRLLSLWSRLTSSLPTFELRLGAALLESPAEILGELVNRLRTLSTKAPPPGSGA